MTKTVVFWGAGATASLGIRTTRKQSAFIRDLAQSDGRPLDERVCKVLRGKADSPWGDALRDLLTILGDRRKVVEATEVDECEIEAMRRHWMETSESHLRRRILHLRATYDWPSLKVIIKACPGSQRSEESHSESESDEGFKINDLFNVMDFHDQSGHGFHADDTFLTPQQVGSAKSALKLLLQAMFFIDWQVACEDKDGQLDLHYQFALALGRRMQREGKRLSHESHEIYESQKFYLGDVSFVSMNYDPIGLWCQTVANRDLNKSRAVPHIGNPARKLEVFLDPAHSVPSDRIEKDKRQRIWHSMSEAVVQRLNEVGHGIRVTKFLLPHGCLCWRECPNCGKLSNYWGRSWALASPTLIPPPPLRAFTPGMDIEDARTDKERKAWKKGEVDARECVHCETLTYAHHTTTVMQSSLKGRPPAFIEEIQRELRVVIKDAKHIVLMGYSLPEDDFVYRAFFAAHTARSGTKSPVKCTVVDKKAGSAAWFGPEALRGKTELHEGTAVKAAQDLFGQDNVRFYRGGVPDVFSEGGTVQDHAVERLLVWS